jgi:multidrug efflux pump subunit AcrA (membrane-fusion protein)
VTTAAIQVHLDPPHLALTLGERATVEVEVFNASAIVDEFRVELVGPAIDPIRPEWVIAQPARLALFPNTSGVVTLTLDVPAASELMAGRHVVGVRVTSTSDSTTAYVEELPVVVTSQPAMSLHLDPQMSTGHRWVTVDAVARNVGNVPLTVYLSASDPASLIRYELSRAEFDLPGDGEERIPITLRARQPLIGTGAIRPFVVAATVEDRADTVGAEKQPYVEAVRTEGQWHQKPMISGRVLTILGALLPMIAIIAAALILRPQPEPVDLTGPIGFGVAGTVETVDVRVGQTVLHSERLATLNRTEALLALEVAQLDLRRAIVELEGVRTKKIVGDAESLIGGDAADLPPVEFLEALATQLLDTANSALAVSSTALTGLSEALTIYCATAEDPGAECSGPSYPLGPEITARLATEAATNPAAKSVVDANGNYRAANITLQSVTRLLDQVRVLVESGGGSASPAAPDDETAAALAAALSDQDQQLQQEYELALLEAQANIATAQLACRAAVQNVGRTVLRAPVDSIVRQIDISAGVQMDADTPAIILERVDGRAFHAPPGQRPPSLQDLPEGVTCPGSLAELQMHHTQQSTAAGQPK